MQELWFLHSASHLMLIEIYMKFREDSLNGFQIIDWTRFVTEALGKNNMSPYPKGTLYGQTEEGVCSIEMSYPKEGVGQILKWHLEYFSSYVHFSKLKLRT